MPESDRRRLRLQITGHVQGVGYRDWMIDIARRLGVDGWVRNRRDGSVEAVIEGPQDKVDALVAAARTGPRGAHVQSVDVEQSSDAVQSGFTRRPTS